METKLVFQILIINMFWKALRRTSKEYESLIFFTNPISIEHICNFILYLCSVFCAWILKRQSYKRINLKQFANLEFYVKNVFLYWPFYAKSAHFIDWFSANGIKPKLKEINEIIFLFPWHDSQTSFSNFCHGFIQNFN